jgi:hypothetical protein
MKNSKMAFLIEIVTLLAISLLCQACIHKQSQSAVEDLMSDTPCAPPCWQGITPGQTTEQEAIDILLADTRSDYILSPSVSKREATRETIVNWVIKDAKMPSEVSVLSSLSIWDGKVHDISLKLDAGLTVQRVIDQWGKPKKSFVYVYGRHMLHGWAKLCYPEQGIEFTAHLPFDQTSLSLDPNDQVVFAFFYAPMTEEQWLNEPLDQNPWRIRPQDPGKITDWFGFGIIPSEMVVSY